MSVTYTSHIHGLDTHSLTQPLPRRYKLCPRCRLVNGGARSGVTCQRHRAQRWTASPGSRLRAVPAPTVLPQLPPRPPGHHLRPLTRGCGLLRFVSRDPHVPLAPGDPHSYSEKE